MLCSSGREEGKDADDVCTSADVAVAVRWAIEKCSNPDVNNANATVLGQFFFID